MPEAPPTGDILRPPLATERLLPGPDEELARLLRAACNDAFDAFFASEDNIRRLNEAVAAPR